MYMESVQTEKNSLVLWFKQSIVAKLGMIAFLSLLLMIPSSLVTDLIYERKGRQKEVMEDVANSWSASQTISGPILVIPYRLFKTGKDMNGHATMEEIIQYVFLMPDDLKIKATTAL